MLISALGKRRDYSGQIPSLVGVNSQFTYGNAPFFRTFPSKWGWNTEILRRRYVRQVREKLSKQGVHTIKRAKNQIYLRFSEHE